MSGDWIDGRNSFRPCEDLQNVLPSDDVGCGPDPDARGLRLGASSSRLPHEIARLGPPRHHGGRHGDEVGDDKDTRH